MAEVLAEEKKNRHLQEVYAPVNAETEKEQENKNEQKNIPGDAAIQEKTKKPPVTKINAFTRLVRIMAKSREEKEKKKKTWLPDASDMQKEHDEMKRIVAIMQLIKDDETMGETVAVNRSEKAEKKKQYRQAITDGANMDTERKAAARRKVALVDKKNLDDRTFEQLIEFAPFLGEEELSEVCRLYGEGMKEKKEGKPDAFDEKTVPALNILTESVMKIRPGDYILSNDGWLAKNSCSLEGMSRALESYKTMLQKNPDYVDYLAGIQTEGGVSMAEQMLRQVEKLTAVSDYYRLRILVIQDDYYMEHAGEGISPEDKKGDTDQIRRLRKRMRASVQAAVNLRRIMGNVDLPDLNLKGVPPFEDDLMKTISMEKADLNVNEEEKPDRIKARLRGLDKRSGMIRQLETERTGSNGKRSSERASAL